MHTSYATVISLLLAASGASPLASRGPPTDCDCDKPPTGPDMSVKPISQPSCTTAEICVEQCKGNSQCQSCAFGLPPDKDAPRCMLFAVPGAHIPPQESEIHVFDRACTEPPTEPPTHEKPRGPPPPNKQTQPSKPEGQPKPKQTAGGYDAGTGKHNDEERKMTPPKTKTNVFTDGKMAGEDENCDDDDESNTPTPGKADYKATSGGKKTGGDEGGKNKTPGPSKNDNNPSTGGAKKADADCDDNDDDEPSAHYKRMASTPQPAHIKPIKSRKDECSVVPQGPAKSKPSPIKTHDGINSLTDCVNLCKRNIDCQS
jgi:hypothetical protein